MLKDTLILAPISAAKMQTAQKPAVLLDVLYGPMAKLVSEPTNDVHFITTAGLYMNNPVEDSSQQRLSLLQRVSEWEIQFNKLIKKLHSEDTSGFVLPEGFRVINWDENLLQSWNDFQINKDKLKKAYSTEGDFKAAVDNDLEAMKRQPTKDNLSFLFEEIAVSALWINGKIPQNQCRLRTSDKIDNGIYITYPGPMMDFMKEGLRVLFKDKTNVIPVNWLDSSRSEVQCEIHRFGRSSGPRITVR